MEFLKKNYEKVVLSVVLLGLAVAAGLLLKRVADENQRLEAIRNLNLTTAPQELAPMDTSTNLTLLARLQRREAIALSGTNNLFNPVTWQRRGERLEKLETGSETGPAALEIIETKPLYTRVSYIGQTDAGGIAQYSFRIQREAAAKPADRAALTRAFTKVGGQSAGLLLREIRPQPPERPTEFVFESLDDKLPMVVGVGKDHESVAGYLVTLRYGPDNRVHRDKRLGDTIVVDGEVYKIVAITETSVTVEAPNRKRTTLTAGKVSAAKTP
jgi:hypothetical protein